MQKLSIIIVSKNSQKYLKKCLESIKKNYSAWPEIVVVDNNSSDRTTVMIEEYFPQVKIIKNNKNYGFGYANNQGAKAARGKYLLFLNPDTEVMENSLESMVDYLENHPKIGVIGPKLIVPGYGVQDDSSCREPSLINLFLLKVNKVIKKFKKNAHLGSIDHKGSKIQNADWVSGAALLVRSDLFEEISGFDTKIFLYYEDVDLGRRVKDQGYQIIYFPAAQILHHGGKSIKEDRIRKKLYYESQIYFYQKHYGKIKSKILQIARFPILRIRS